MKSLLLLFVFLAIFTKKYRSFFKTRKWAFTKLHSERRSSHESGNIHRNILTKVEKI